MGGGPLMVALFLRPDSPEVASTAAAAVAWLREHGHIAAVAATHEGARVPGAETLPPQEAVTRAALVLVLGGDGTLITAARYVAAGDTPILGVNMGSLGFITEVTVDEMLPALERALAGASAIERRFRLDVHLWRGNETVLRGVVLNEVVVNKSALARMFDTDLFIDGRYVTAYKADGLIAATPTGSTAYNMSAGGPILYPTAKSMIFTPICPHALTQRPLVVSDITQAEMHVRTPERETYLTLDGTQGVQVFPGDRIRVAFAPTPLGIIKSPSRDYFQILREKLRWGER